MIKKSKSGSSRKKKKQYNEKPMPSKASVIRKYNKIMKQRRNDPEELILLYNELLDSNLNEQRINILKKLIKIKPNNFRYFYSLGNYYIEKAQEARSHLKPCKSSFSQALTALEKARDLAPEYLKICPLLAVAHAGIHNFDKALSFLKYTKKIGRMGNKVERTELKEMFFQASKVVSMYLITQYDAHAHPIKLAGIKKRQHYEAIRYLEKAIKICKNDYGSFIALGTAYVHRKQFDKAIKVFSRSIEIDSSGPVPYVRLGFMFLRKKDFKKAFSFFQTCLDILELENMKSALTEDIKVRYFYCLGMLNWQEGRLEEAKENLLKTQYYINKYKFKFLQPYSLLPKIIDIDRKLELLYLANDLNDLCVKLEFLYLSVHSLIDTMKAKKISNPLIIDLLGIKHDIIFNLFFTVSYSLGNKIEIVSVTKIPKETRVEIEKGTFGFKSCKKYLIQFNLKASVEAVEGIKHFIKEVKSHDNISKLSISEQQRIIRKLGQPLRILDGETSRASYSQSLQSILREQMESMFEKYIKPLPKQTAELSTEQTIEKIKKEYEIGIPPKTKKKKIKLIKDFVLKSNEDKIKKALEIMFTQGKSIRYIPQEIKGEITANPEAPKKYVIYYTGRNKFNCSDKAIDIIRKNPKDFNIQIFLDFDGTFLVEGKREHIFPQARKGLRCFLKNVGISCGFSTIGYEVWENEDMPSRNIHSLKKDVIEATKGILREFITSETRRYFIEEGFTYCLIDSLISY